jgi:hypothetical protein
MSNELKFAISRGASESFEIEFSIARNNGHANAIAISAHHQSFENLARRQPNLACD